MPQNVKVLIKRAYEDDVELNDKVLKPLELLCIKMNSGEYKYKIGDGKTPYSELSFVNNISDIERFVVYAKDGYGICEVLINSFSELLSTEKKNMKINT